MPSITLPKDKMLDLLDDKDATVRDRIIGTRRWSLTHEFIFRHEGKLYRAIYSAGATENQDETPFECQDEVECKEVREVPSVDYESIL